MSEYLNGWTLSGTLGLIVTIVIAIMKRVPRTPPQAESWFARIARVGASSVRLQITEGTLDSVKESLLLERSESDSLRARLRDKEAENTSLRNENDQLRALLRTGSSDESNDGCTE